MRRPLENSTRAVDQKQLIHSKPWSTLIILDACRYDAFKQVYGEYLTGKLIKAYSPASCTRDWLQYTFTENDYGDITYISANMYMQRYTGRHKWQYPYPERFKKIVDVWRTGLTPDLVNRQALVTKGRKILHYNLPHRPYLGKVKTEDWLGYVSNLRHVLKYVFALLTKIGGYTIVTSDHGELFKPLIYHPCSKEDQRLRHVPFLDKAKIKL